MRETSNLKWMRALPLFGLGLLFLIFSIGLIWSFSAPVERAIYGLVQLGNGLGGESSSGESWLEGDQASRQLTNRAIVKSGQEPELVLRFSDQKESLVLSKNPIYVRAMSLDNYDPEQGQWTATRSESQEFLADEDGWTSISPSRDNQPEIDYSVTYGGARGSWSRLLIGLQGMIAAEVPEVMRMENGFLVIRQAEREQAARYRARSQPVFIGDVTTEEIGDFLRRRFPSNPELKELAELASGGAEAPLDQLRNIESYMHANFKYSVDGDGLSENPLANFLFREKKGHCELFATAAALFARELGINSRIVFGWAGGDFYKNESTFVFRSKHAHAWLELELGDSGWVAMDATAPSEGSGVSPTLAAQDENPPVEEELVGIDLSSGEVGSRYSALVGWLLFISFAVILAAIIWIIVKGRGRDNHWSSATNERSAARGTYLVEWEMAIRRRGLLTKGETLKAQIMSLDVQPDFSDELISYHYGITYEGREHDRGVEKRLAGRIRSWVA